MIENILHTQYWQNYRKPDFQIKSKCLFSAYSTMKQISKAYLEPNRTSNIDFCKKKFIFSLMFEFWIRLWYPRKHLLVKSQNKNTSKRSEICSKLTIKTSERRHWSYSGVYIVKFDHVLHLFVFLLLNLDSFVLAISSLNSKTIHDCFL